MCVSYVSKQNQMKHLTTLLTMAITLTGLAQQMPYNPDANGQIESVCGCADETDLNDETIFSLTAPQGFKLGPVLFASYGTPVGDCDGLLGYGGCHSENSIEIIENLITENDSTISIYPNNNTFADPCTGIVKRLCVRIGLLQLGPLGCTDIESCNFDEQAVYDDGSCISCDLFAERCLDGTVWDEELRGCVVASASDTDFDGCVGMTDLLDLLSVFGTCNEVPWSCGDPLEYQGYDYETVQIGEQCWFAENLRSQVMSNGDLLIENPGDSAWAALNVPAWSFFGDNSESMVNGLLYNGHAAMDERGICPSGWFTPSDEAWKELETHLGMTASEVDQDGWRGTNQGAQLKGSEQDSPSWDGLNEVDFGASPAGFRSSVNGESYDADVRGYFWTSSAYSSLSWFRMLESDNDQIRRTWSGREAGMSIRCVMSSE